MGNALAQIARALNIRVYGTAGSKEGIAIAKKCGCLQIFNHDDADLYEKIKKRVGGIDVLVEVKPQNLESNLALMNHGGRIILLGPHEDQIQLYLRPFLTKEVYLTGANLGNATINDLHGKSRIESNRFTMFSHFRNCSFSSRSQNSAQNRSKVFDEECNYGASVQRGRDAPAQGPNCAHFRRKREKCTKLVFSQVSCKKIK